MLRLFVNTYEDPDPPRATELAECLRRNYQNPLFDEIVELTGRPTFRQFFAEANRVIGPNDLAVDANSAFFLTTP